MYHSRYTFAFFCIVVLIAAPPAFSQTATSAPDQPAPAVRRWLDVQSLVAGMRYRFTENSADRKTVDDLQYQTQFRGRFLFDKAGRYNIGTFVTTGSSFRSSWNCTGAGSNLEAHPLHVRQLWLSASPTRALEFQGGGMAANRGELADAIASDNDSFIIAARATVRPSKGWLSQLSGTAGYFNDAPPSDFFKQVDDAHFNYGQALAGFRLGARASASVDYTYERGRDILREGVVFRMPKTVRLLTGVRLESYQRVDPDKHAGYNASADVRVQKLTATVGLMSTDRNYGPFNGDRYELGSRYYYVINYPLTPALQLQLYHTRAYDIDFPITIKQRFDFVVSYNPTAALKKARVF